MESLLLELGEVDSPDPMLNWEAVFGNARPVELELGIGKGRFLINEAQTQPQVNFVGVEWAAKYLRLAHQRSRKRTLTNIRLARVDAREFIEHFVPTASLQGVHIYFPDPWPKKRHHKRRLFNGEFLPEVERTLEPQGRLWLATDHLDYFEVMLEVLEQTTCLWQIDAEWRGEMTNYEAKFVAQGRPIYRRVMQRQ